jgi:hypothetical protein
MAGEPHLGGGRDRDDLAEEMVDPLPVLVLGEDPALVGGTAWSVLLQRKAALREPPRPGSRAVRGMPMMQRLYLAAGMPAAASRSGSLPSRMCGLSASSIGRGCAE